MDLRFDAIQSHPANQVFHVVFFPDRVYHASYLNATRSTRYTYAVDEVRSKSDAMVLKGCVRMDDKPLTNFLRIEYRAGRLTEQARLKQRFANCRVIAWVKIEPEGLPTAEARVILTYCPWVDAFQGEIWETLETPVGLYHDFKVSDMMGAGGSITRIPAFSPALADPRKIKRVFLAFREGPTQEPSGFGISDEDAGWDNFFGRNVQTPNVPNPSDSRNTVDVQNYQIDFQRGWFLEDTSAIPPVRYRNAMMLESDLTEFANRFFGGDRAKMDRDNITDMRWIFQQELGSNLVFFHEVTIPPGGVEGTHQHIGSEELYYIVEGDGIAYMGKKDDPLLEADDNVSTVNMPIFGLDQREMKELPVKSGSVIFTKSGGMHGIRNPGTKPLKFVAFLYHAS